MIEFKYDEKTYRKMSLRLVWWFYAIIFGVLLAAYAWIMGSVISNMVTQKTDLVILVMGIVFLVILLAAMVVTMVVGVRRQLSKSFTMYSDNGVVIQQAEVTDEELIIRNVSRQNVTRTNRRDIASVKKYKGFFVVTTNAKVKWAVPLDENTQLLYDVLTGKASVADLPTQSKSEESHLAEEKTTQQPDIPLQSNALNFEYELSEQQAVSMLTKVISVRFRMLLASTIILAGFTAFFLFMTVTDYLKSQQITAANLIFAVLFAVLTALSFVVYVNKNKSGKISGNNYFQQQSKDGQCMQRVELYDQGIVVVNILRDTRVYFRLADMEKVSLFADFFFVDFKSKEVLPVPLTDSTKKLYDILNAAVNRK